MDNLEKIINEDLTRLGEKSQINVDEVLQGVHTRIRRRTIRRKALYSTPIVALLALMVIVMIPGDPAGVKTPGSELLIAGWEDSWTEIQSIESDDRYEQFLYEGGVDYLTDEEYYLYSSEADELMDEEDIDAFVHFLEEV